MHIIDSQHVDVDLSKIRLIKKSIRDIDLLIWRSYDLVTLLCDYAKKGVGKKKENMFPMFAE